MQVVDKKVQLNLVGIDGNAFYILGAFRKQAKKEKWTEEEIEAVLDEAKKGDYNHLLATIMDHCEHGGLDADEDEDWEGGDWEGEDEDDYDDYGR